MGRDFTANDPEFLRISSLLDENFRLLSGLELVLLSEHGWLRFFPPFKAAFRKFMANRDAIVDFMQQEVETHKKNFLSDPSEEPSDYIYAYLKASTSNVEGAMQGRENFSEWQLIMILNDLWSAGLETSLTTLKWALLYIANRPQLQDRIQTEIDAFCANTNNEVSMMDRQNLPLTAATMLEVQRLAKIVPINMPHRVTEDVYLDGVLIPADTGAILQISAIHMDPEIFPEPKMFNPARFLNEQGSSLKSVPELIPFSIGKRQCLGESLAKAELFLLFIALVRRFGFSVPLGLGSEKPVVGITSTPENSLFRVTLRNFPMDFDNSPKLES